jgi:hypothetical protein
MRKMSLHSFAHHSFVIHLSIDGNSAMYLSAQAV